MPLIHIITTSSMLLNCIRSPSWVNGPYLIDAASDNYSKIVGISRKEWNHSILSVSCLINITRLWTAVNTVDIIGVTCCSCHHPYLSKAALLLLMKSTGVFSSPFPNLTMVIPIKWHHNTDEYVQKSTSRKIFKLEQGCS